MTHVGVERLRCANWADVSEIFSLLFCVPVVAGKRPTLLPRMPVGDSFVTWAGDVTSVSLDGGRSGNHVHNELEQDKFKPTGRYLPSSVAIIFRTIANHVRKTAEGPADRNRVGSVSARRQDCQRRRD